MTIEREYRNQAEQLGQGYDSFDDRIKLNSAIDYSEREVKEDTTSQCTFFLQKVENKQKLGEILNTSISGSASLLLFRGEAKAKYFSQINTEKQSVLLFLNYQFIGASRRIMNPKLSDTAQNLLHETRRNPHEFRRVYGDELICGFRKGAEYSALIQIESDEKDDKNQIALEAKAYINLLIKKIEADGKIENNTNQSFENKNTTIYCYKNGLPIEYESPSAILTIDDMIKDFNHFKRGLAETGGKENIAFFADYDQLIDTRDCSILTPELRTLKDKLKILRAIKMQKQVQLVQDSNNLRFNPSNKMNVTKPQNMAELEKSIYEIDNFIRRCPIEPDLIDSEQYRRLIG